MNKPQILVVEDDTAVGNLITTTLETQNYLFHRAKTGAGALMDALSYRPDVILLDLGLPDMDGVTLIQKIRSWSNLPIIVISARSEDSDKVSALDAGADDYLTKPFHFAELEARVRGLLRRRFTQQDRLLTFRGVMLDTAAHAVEAAGQPLTLTRKEYALLEYLLLHRGKVVSAEEHVWDGGVDSLSNALRVHMASLRKKLRAALGCDLIRTKVGVGYYLDEGAEV